MIQHFALPSGTADPFSEFTDEGFRGFGRDTESVCGRTCAWYDSLEDKEELINSPKDNERFILTQADDDLFKLYCNDPGSGSFGFEGRGKVSGGRDSEAPVSVEKQTLSTHTKHSEQFHTFVCG